MLYMRISTNRALILAFAFASVGCTNLQRAQPTHSLRVSSTDRRAVHILLKQLYQSFNYGPGQEPNWGLMRASFLDGAQFVPEPSRGTPVRPYHVDKLITKWQSSMRGTPSLNHGYSEWIESTNIDRVGDMLRVDVIFYGKEPADPYPRKPGLDSLILVRVGDTWKVLSFIVHKESKL